MARGKKTDDSVRAQAISALMAGQGVMEVAAAYSLPESTVRGFLESTEFAEVRAKKQDEFGELLSSYVRETLTTLVSQQQHFRDKEWLKRQPAADIAVLHGVSADKAIRILEAAERASASDAAGTD